MKRHIQFILLLVLCQFSFAQESLMLQSDPNHNLNMQANDMGKKFIDKDYDAYTAYIYPEVIEMAGGKTEILRLIKTQIDQMNSQGVIFNKVTFEVPYPIISKANELQTTIIQKLNISTPQGDVVGDYTLIAISSDNGANWTFIDTSGKTIETMRESFPHLSPSLIIPEKK